MRLLSAFVRSPAGSEGGVVTRVEVAEGEAIFRLREDLQEAMNTIGYRDGTGVKLEQLEGYLPDLSGACLRHLSLERANLSGIILAGADLTSAYLPNANLSDTRGSHANFTGAILSSAIFSGATLRFSHFPKAKLPLSNLSKARLDRADLTDAEVICSKFVSGNPVWHKPLWSGLIPQWSSSGGGPYPIPTRRGLG